MWASISRIRKQFICPLVSLYCHFTSKWYKNMTVWELHLLVCRSSTASQNFPHVSLPKVSTVLYNCVFLHAACFHKLKHNHLGLALLCGDPKPLCLMKALFFQLLFIVLQQFQLLFIVLQQFHVIQCAKPYVHNTIYLHP